MRSNRFRGNELSPGANIAVNFSFIIYSLLCILPIVLIVIVSFSEENTLTKTGAAFIPGKWSLTAYDYLLGNGIKLIKAYGVTAIVTTVVAFLSVIIMAMYAYPLSRKDFKHRNIFSFICIFTVLFNPGLVPFYIFYTKTYGLKNNLLSLIIPFLMVPMYVLIIRTFFQSNVPDSVIESAKIDGAGEFRILFSIVLHLAKPAIATIMMFNILTVWNDWQMSYMFIDKQELYPLQLFLMKFEENKLTMSPIGSNGKNIVDIPTKTARFASTVLAVVPVIFVYPYFQRFFVKGISLGSVKG